MSNDWQSSTCNCCGAGIIGCLICISTVECLNYGFAMKKMDPDRSCFLETFRSIICCCVQRGEMRKKYDIAGDPTNDCLMGICCYPCTGVQMYAEAQLQNGETIV